MTIKKGIGKFLKYGTLVSSFCFIAVTMAQVYARFFMESAPSWTEEAARFFFIYAMSFAAGLAMKGNYYVKFDVVYNKLNNKQKQILDALVSFFTILLFLILTCYAISFVNVGITERSPSVGFSMSIAFGSIVVMGLFISIYAIWDVIKAFKKLKQ
ncbi:TRAP transporter small permease [Seonamhaeicola marinus]|uniref:TRAP transporter small permease n=1 Tax=Seonamhaeicola marinus TaxID=1912246 RepID=A0A5D0HJR9_9FLAO|nr:TRAP transporter small permease subunit [Seonamhaeicola marinus]TYA71633.1 TRAP transporter small permease [Seonamhaeicola marinus]